MLAESIRGLTISSLMRIYVTVLAEHMREFRCREGIKEQFHQIGLGDKLTIVELDAPTGSQPETVAKTIEAHDIKGPICIKDSDNYFRLTVPSGNFVSVVDLNSVGFINPSNKSYAAINEHHLITNIVEKRVISNFFCCGIYGFQNAHEFLQYFNRLSSMENLYISHLVYQMILDGNAFTAPICDEYSDWGTLKDWNRYKSQFATLFIDLDGVLVRNSAEYFEPLWGQTPSIEENVRVINQLYKSGKAQIIITTSRKEKAREITLRQLELAGVNFHQIIFGLNHGKRIVINDYARSNPFKSCDAVNIARDASELGEMLEAALFIDVDCSPSNDHGLF